jgi:FkbM family methyltransferase
MTLQRLDHLYAMLMPIDLLRVVDIGANPMNSIAPYRDLLDRGMCCLTGFEPQQDTLVTLNAQKGPNETYIAAAVGDGTSHCLHLYHGSGLVSLFKLRAKTVGHLRGLRRAARNTGTIDIKTQRLDDLPQLGRIDFLKIDIQGAELMVFENALRSLESVIAIQTEVNFYPLYDAAPSFGDIDVFLRQQGFVPHSYMHIEKRIIQSRFSGELTKEDATQMLDGDILYLRDLSGIADWHSDDIKRMALLADGVYNYADIVLRCLDVLQSRGLLRQDQIDTYLALRDTL